MMFLSLMPMRSRLEANLGGICRYCLFAGFNHFEEVRQNLSAGIRRLFRMELNTEHLPFLHCARKRYRVRGSGHRIRFRGDVAMREIEILTWGVSSNRGHSAVNSASSNPLGNFAARPDRPRRAIRTTVPGTTPNPTGK